MGGRCTGDCCREFTLLYPPCALAMLGVQRRLRGRGRVTEVDKIAAMVVHLRSTDVDPATGERMDGPLHVYGCKHHDPDSGDCLNYGSRPTMCRDYPYERACRYAGCTWTERRFDQVVVAATVVTKEPEVPVADAKQYRVFAVTVEADAADGFPLAIRDLPGVVDVGELDAGHGERLKDPTDGDAPDHG